MRVAVVAAQAAGVVALLAAVNRTRSGELVAAWFTQYDAYLSLSLNPLTFGRDVFHHLTRITSVFPGGPSWFNGLCVVVVAVGLVATATGRARRAIAARFMIVLVLLAFAGALAGWIPFGPRFTVRVTLWLVPIVAFGLAVVLQRVRRAAAESDTRLKIGFDVVAFSFAGLLLFTPIGVHRRTRLATRKAPAGWLAPAKSCKP